MNIIVIYDEIILYLGVFYMEAAPRLLVLVDLTPHP
jgi:hypothetical protein